MINRSLGAQERLLRLAHEFVQETRNDLGRAAAEGSDIPARLRTVHERPGHASPEFRTLAVPIPPGAEGGSPEVLSSAIARYARRHPPTCLLLALDLIATDSDGQPQSILVAEARDRAGNRLFLVQPFSIDGGRVEWHEPVEGGWRDPGDDEMILDAAFA